MIGRINSLICLLLTLGLAAAALAVGPDSTFEPIPDEEVPYGIAANWIMGHQLLAEGEIAEALPFLHQAYRAQPDVPAIALDFQEALTAEGYFQDALNVMDQLVASWPDSLSYRLRRSALYLQLGQPEDAMEDLRIVREGGGITVDLVMTEASLLAARGKFSQAMDVCRDGIAQMPEFGARIYLGMAALEQDRDQTRNIPPLMSEAVGTYPEVPELWRIWVLAMAELGLKEEAVAVARQGDSHFPRTSSGMEPGGRGDGAGHPNKDSFLIDLADFYAQQGKIADAVAILQPLADEDELGLGPSLWLARLQLGSGHVRQGANLVQDILDRWPESSRAWFLQGRISEAEDDHLAAIGHFKKAVELAPYDAEIRLGLVRAMLLGWETELGHTDPSPDQTVKEEQLFENTSVAAGLMSGEDRQGQLILGYAFRASGHLVEAAERFEMAAEDPDLRLLALIQRSICLDELGKVKQARHLLERLVQDYPEDAEVANSLGYFLAEKNRGLDQAQELIEFALAKDPGNGAFLDSMGWVLFRQKRLEAAFDYLIQAVNVLPDDPVILEHLGIVLRDMGQFAEARGMLGRALAQGGDPTRLNSLLAELDELLGDQ